MALNQVPIAGGTKSKPLARHMLYAINAGDAKTSGVSSYALDLNSGALQLAGQVSSGGEGPCYIAVDAVGRSAYVANYNGGTVASFKVRPDGTLSEPVDRIDFHNEVVFRRHGPVAARQDGPHPHSAMFSPDYRFLIVNDLGNDDIAIFPVDSATAHLGTPHLFTTMSAGSGPRHIAFHPNGRWAYGINELANRIDQYLYTSARAAGSIEAQALLTAAGHSISTIDPSFREHNTAAELIVAATGDFLYASNRGEDTLVVFAIEPVTGAPRLVQRISCGGKTPRHFTMDRSGHWIICGNQDSANVTVFARDEGTGKLTGPTQTLALESPMFSLLV